MASGRPSSTLPRDRFVRDIRRGIALTERDERLLLDLARHRVMSRTQFVALGYFNSVPRANSRLRLLFDHGYVRRQFVPEGSYGAEALYLPGMALVDLLVSRLSIERGEAQKLCRLPVAPLFLEHTLKVTDVRISFLASAAKLGTQIVRWLSEREVFHEYALRDGKNGKFHWHSLRPDAYLQLGSEKGHLHCFLEVDLGHSSGKAFAEKIKRYREYGAAGIFAETYGGQEFVVMTVTTGKRRMEHLLELAPREGGYFQFTTFAELDAHGPFAPIWVGQGPSKRSTS